MTTNLSIALAFSLASVAIGADSGKTRVATCDDANNHMEYACNPDNVA